MTNPRLMAMVDHAVTDPMGLLRIEDCTVARQVLFRAAVHLNIAETLDRIRNAACSKDLIKCLPELFGSDAVSLRPVALFLAADVGRNHQDTVSWDRETVTWFADLYWSTLIRERLLAQDWRRAWDEIKNAVKGLNDDQGARDAGLALVGGRSLLLDLITELHELLCSLHLIGELPSQIERAPYGYETVPVPRYPGIMLAHQLGCITSAREFTQGGRMIVSLARYMSKKKNGTRRAKITSRLRASGK